MRLLTLVWVMIVGIDGWLYDGCFRCFLPLTSNDSTFDSNLHILRQSMVNVFFVDNNNIAICLSVVIQLAMNLSQSVIKHDGQCGWYKIMRIANIKPVDMTYFDTITNINDI